MKKDWQTKNPSTGLRADPSAWLMVKLGEVCDFQNGFAFKSKLFSQSGLPILRISNIQQDKISYNRLVFFNQINYNINFEKYKVKKGDLVIAMSGATTGKLAISNTDEIFYLNQRVGKFKPKKELLKEFLYYFLTTKIEENLKISQGAAQPNLSTIQIKNFEIPLPPISEQKRIVGILDGVFENIEKAKEDTEKNLKNAKELFQSYLQRVFKNPKDDWQTKKLGEVCEISIGKTPARGNKRFWDEIKENSNVWLSIRDLNNSDKKEVFDSREYISNSGVKLCKKVKQGTLLASFKLTLGRLAFAGIDLYTNEAIAAFEIKNNKTLNKKYLYWYLSFFDWYAETKGDIKVKGKTLNKAKLKEMQVLIPPLSEQKRIVGRLDALSEEVKKLEQTYQQKLDNLEELKKSILKQAFNADL